ncbi:MAG: hypothetical protein K2P17_07015 [Helicobacteraceae bacterium]|nr:hypothetical protein [Helicobacteraceae bacterium]
MKLNKCYKKAEACIIDNSSQRWILPLVGRLLIIACNHVVIGLTGMTALDCAAKNIRINVIFLGVYGTRI